MGEVGVLFGLGIILALYIFVAFKIKEQHFVFQLILIVFTMTLAVLVPKTVMDFQDNCVPVIANETVAGNVTSYEYKDYCNNTTQVPLTFFRIVMWAISLFWLYLLIYGGWYGYTKLRDWLIQKNYKFGDK